MTSNSGKVALSASTCYLGQIIPYLGQIIPYLVQMLEIKIDDKKIIILLGFKICLALIISILKTEPKFLTHAKYELYH